MGMFFNWMARRAVRRRIRSYKKEFETIESADPDTIAEMGHRMLSQYGFTPGPRPDKHGYVDSDEYDAWLAANKEPLERLRAERPNAYRVLVDRIDD